MRGRSRSSAPSSHVVLDEQLARREQAVALPVDGVVPPTAAGCRCTTSTGRGARGSTRAGARGGRVRARASAGARPSCASGQQPQAVVVGRARARAAASGPAKRTFRPSTAELRRAPVPGRSRPRVPPASSDARRRGRAARDAPGRGARRRQRELLPGDLVAGRRPSVASRRKKRNVTKRSPSAPPGRSSSHVERPARRDAERGQLPAGTHARRRGQLPLARGTGRGRRSRAGCGSGTGRRRSASTRTGWERNFSSCSAGCGVRSGQTSPSAQKFASCGSRRSRRRRPSTRGRRASSCRMPWSIHSQTKPPWSAAWRLEGGEVVGEPAVRVAHRVRVLAEDDRAWVVVAPRVRLDRVDSGYIGQTMSVAAPAARPVAPDRPLVVQRPRRVAARIQPAAASWLGP